MVDVVCDTSFLIHLATRRIKNISKLEIEIGQIQFVVPNIVINEIHQLCKNENKKQAAISTLKFIKNLKKIKIAGKFADEAIVDYVKKHGGTIATMDKELKNKVKNCNGTVISFSNDRIVLES